MHALMLTSLLFTNAGEAQWEAMGQAIGEAMRDFHIDFRAQGQLTLTADLADIDDFESSELELNATIWGVGGSAAVGYDRLRPDGRGTLHGGHVRLALQLRPLAWLDARPHDWSRSRTRAFHWIDPSLELGGALGGFGDEYGESSFAGWAYLGAGLDLAPFAGEIPIVLTVRYRWTPDAMRSPEGLPAHHLILGLGLRAAD